MTHHHRDALINGLRELAAFLETNPGVPIAATATVHFFARHTSDDDNRAEIDQIAARIGTPLDADDLPHGHYATSRFFGPVEDRAVAILAPARARYDAQNSYRDCIQPDDLTPAT